MGSSENIDTARRLYEAIHDRQIDALRDSIAPDFVGHATAGMPGGIVGRTCHATR